MKVNDIHRSLQIVCEADDIDKISLDVPLFIRLLEYAREDATDDMALHYVTEKAIELSKLRSLTMSDYDEITKGR